MPDKAGRQCGLHFADAELHRVTVVDQPGYGIGNGLDSGVAWTGIICERRIRGVDQ